MSVAHGSAENEFAGDDNDLNWQRHGFQGATAATEADDRWIGLDYGWDLAGRLIQTSAADSRTLGTLQVIGAKSAASAMNRLTEAAIAATTVHMNLCSHHAPDIARSSRIMACRIALVLRDRRALRGAGLKLTRRGK